MFFSLLIKIYARQRNSNNLIISTTTSNSCLTMSSHSLFLPHFPAWHCRASMVMGVHLALFKPKEHTHTTWLTLPYFHSTLLGIGTPILQPQHIKILWQPMPGFTWAVSNLRLTTQLSTCTQVQPQDNTRSSDSENNAFSDKTFQVHCYMSHATDVGSSGILAEQEWTSWITNQAKKKKIRSGTTVCFLYSWRGLPAV